MGQKPFFDPEASPVKSNNGNSTIQHGNGSSPAHNQEESALVSVFEPNWWEFRLKGKQPERRGYHSSFAYEKK
jgi:hypothetical protein